MFWSVGLLKCQIIAYYTVPTNQPQIQIPASLHSVKSGNNIIILFETSPKCSRKHSVILAHASNRCRTYWKNDAKTAQNAIATVTLVILERFMSWTSSGNKIMSYSCTSGNVLYFLKHCSTWMIILHEININFFQFIENTLWQRKCSAVTREFTFTRERANYCITHTE